MTRHTTSCPSCGADSTKCYRCTGCGKDLTGVSDTQSNHTVVGE